MVRHVQAPTCLHVLLLLCTGGGDGTLNEVVCALMTHRDEMQRQGISVGLLPLGTANDFACVCGISVVSMVQCCHTAAATAIPVSSRLQLA